MGEVRGQMYLEYEDAQARGLRRYVRLVTEALGLGGNAYFVQLDPPPANAYLALERRLPEFPDRDAALLWSEDTGWSLVVESHCGEDLIVLSYLGTDVLPAPRVVARFAEDLCDGTARGVLDPPGRDPVDVRERLAAYAAPALAG
ncbi:hypothetical protein FHX45_004372 [Amycolatopsis granulosa]|nr:hypothetical protein [Amycolatopsis granulosa]